MNIKNKPYLYRKKMEEELIKLLNQYHHQRRAIENNFNITYNLSLSKRLVSLNKRYTRLIMNQTKKKPTIYSLIK